jgi:HD-GYP domain-containing protein (c-di-GMP phosphodiesterase class II)
MNLNKLKSISNSKLESFERFIQNARVNEELQKMNKEITFEDAKNYLIELFKDNKAYEIFDKEIELKRKRHIVIPNTLKWEKGSFTIWNPNKNCGFILYTDDELKKDANFYIKGFTNDKDNISNYINTQNEFDDLKEKIDFYINSYDYLEEIKETVNFNKLTIDYNWFAYTNMKNLTEDCIKYNTGNCNIKECKNCNKCNMYISKMQYTENMYNHNQNINAFVEMICKESQLPTSIDQEIISDEMVIRYNIGNLGIDVTTCSKKDKLYSSANITVYTHKNNQMIPLYNANEKLYSKKGKEQFNLFFDLVHMYSANKKEWIKYAKGK